MDKIKKLKLKLKNNKNKDKFLNLNFNDIIPHITQFCDLRDYRIDKNYYKNKVSFIIPTYNRIKGLILAIESCKTQTYKNIEIIIINDNSSDKEYYEELDIFKGCLIIDLKHNSKKIFGFSVPGGWQRNFGFFYSTVFI